MRIIKTKQFTLRPLNCHDKVMFCQLYTSEVTMAYISPAYSDKKAQNSFKSACNFNHNTERVVNTWAIELNNTEVNTQAKLNKTIGIVMLYDEWYKQLLFPIEIGILLLPSATGMSYGKEALAGLLSYCFNDLALPQINIRFHPNNLAMRYLAEQLGFKTPNQSDIYNNLPVSKENNNPKKSSSDEIISFTEEQMLVQHLYAKQWQANKK